MFRLRKFKMVSAAVLLSVFWAGEGQVLADELLDAIPADATFCARLNNFDASMAKIDQFLAGVSLIPGGAAMALRGHLAGILGNPALPGIDTAGHVGIYGKISREELTSGNMDPSNPAANEFVVILVPVNDYDSFISSNPNCGQPDEKGVSRIKAGPLGELATIRAGGYALVTAAEDYAKLMAEAERISSGSGSGISTVLGATMANSAQKQPIWICANWGALSGMMMPALMGAQQMTPHAPGEQNQQPQADPLAAAMAKQADIAALAAITPYASITINPQPELLSVRAELFPSTQTPANEASLKDSPLIAEMTKLIGALTVQQASEQLAEITRLIPDAGNADFVGTVPLPAQMTMPPPGTQTQAIAPIVYAIKLGDNNAVADVVVPKATVPALAGMVAMMFMGSGMFGGPEITISEGDMGGAMEIPSFEIDEDAQVVVEAAPELTAVTDANSDSGIIDPMSGIYGARLGVRFGAPVESMTKALGEPTAVSGRMYQYFNSGLYVVTDSDGKMEAIYCGAVNSADMVNACTWRTRRNIMMGSTAEDLVNAYGKPTHTYEYSDKTGTVRYEYDNIKAQFTLKDNKVVQMIFRRAD